MCKGPESSQELDIFKELKQDQVSCSILSKWEMAGLDLGEIRRGQIVLGLAGHSNRFVF